MTTQTKPVAEKKPASEENMLEQRIAALEARLSELEKHVVDRVHEHLLTELGHSGMPVRGDKQVAR